MSEPESPLSVWRIGLSLVAALGGVALSYHFKLGIGWKLSVAISRAICQLLLLGFVLLSFLFSTNSLPLIMLYLTAMLLIAATEVTNRQVRTYDGQFLDAVISCFLSGGLCGIFTSAVVFNPSPWWNPRVFIPTAGMIIGNSVSGPAVSMDRLLSDITDKKHETEVRLALGATGFEAMLPTVRAAVLAALMPNLNSLSIVGVVSIPGMMTGQLLGGSSPLVAAEYQMAILFMITATTTISTYLAVMLATRHAVLSPEQRLTPERIRKVSGPKQTVDVAVLNGLRDLVVTVFSVGQRRLCCICAYCAPLWSGTHQTPPAGTGGTTAYTPLPQSNNSDLELTRLTTRSESGGDLHNVVNREHSATHGTMDRSAEHRASYELRDAAPFDRSHAPILEIQGLNIRSGELMLFNSDLFSLAVHAGQRLTIEGRSGLGKTRLLRAIAQLDDSECGTCTLLRAGGSLSTGAGQAAASVTLHGKQERAELHRSSSTGSYALWRSRVMYIPQALPPLAGTPLELLKEAIHYRSRLGFATLTEGALPSACDQLEHRLLLPAGKLSQQWAALSGGERQRAIIVCGLILACDPNSPLLAGERNDSAGQTEEPASREVGSDRDCVLLLDEPTAACDAAACAAVEEALVASGVACIIVTHDPRQAQRLAHTRVMLE